MARNRTDQPTDGELKILNVLWQRGPSRLSEISEALSTHRQVALTTVATMLKIMRRKGQVERVDNGEGVRWRATLSQGEAGSSLVRRLVERVFEGSTRALVLHLFQVGQLSEEDHDEIRNLIEKAKQRKPNIKRR